MKITEICAALDALECAREKATKLYRNPSRDSDDTQIVFSLDHVGQEVARFLPYGENQTNDARFFLSSRNCPISFRKIAEVVRAAKEVDQMPRGGDLIESALDRLGDKISELEVQP